MNLTRPHSMNKLLMIAFHYPPAVGSGYLRSLKFSKYLPQFGWSPIMLTVRSGARDPGDTSMIDAIPATVPIYRTACLDARRHLSIRGKHLAALTVPDAYLSWLFPAVIRGLRAVQQHDVRAIYSTSPVPTAHLIARVLKWLTGLPWLADFRDPWIEERPESEQSALRSRVERRLERIVIRGADQVIATTGALRTELARRHPDCDERKFGVITNGYDEDDFDFLDDSPERQPQRFDLVHAGLVNGTYRSPKPLLQAARKLLDSGQLPRDDLRLRFLGAEQYLRSGEFRRMVEQLKLQDVVDVVGFLPYRECLQLLSRSALLVLLQAGDDTSSLIPAKAFEYMRLRRPVLALTPPGATADLVRDCGAGTVVDPLDVAAIQDALLAHYRRFEQGDSKTSIREEVLTRYSRRALAGQLADRLGGQVAAAGSPRNGGD